jgi:DNA-directed RNA polymerase subunit E'/Rpb7
MNNDIYKHLKTNLKDDVEKKCNKYGYLEKVYKITEYKDGYIEPENFIPIYKVKFTCRMCIPNINTNLICSISKMNKALIVAENGPIFCLITIKNVNIDNFIFDNNDVLNYKNNGVLEKLKPKDIVKINILARKFYKGDNNIKVIGFLDNIATDKEKQIYYNDIGYKNEVYEPEYNSESDNMNSDNEIYKDQNITDNETDNEIEEFV